MISKIHLEIYCRSVKHHLPWPKSLYDVPFSGSHLIAPSIAKDSKIAVKQIAKVKRFPVFPTISSPKSVLLCFPCPLLLYYAPFC